VSYFRRGVRVALRALLFALLVALVAEGFLRAASLLARDRAGTWRPGAEVRILSVGDSHTYGTNVAEEESYPAQLQRLLDEVEPGRFSAVNLGVPGISSTQVRRRLAANVARYEPDLVIVWCGVNDYWNTTEMDDADATWSARLDSLALRSRLFRFVRVWQHDRALSASTELLRTGGIHQRLDLEEGRGWGASPDVTVTFHHGGRAEAIRTESGGLAEGSDTSARSYREFRSMATWLRAARVGLIFIRYPLAAQESFDPANRAMERVAGEFSLPIVDSWAAISRIPEEEWEWKSMSHPSGPMYREIARDLVPLVVQLTDATR
jgi:lysophospholipase L1-like esterase